MESLSLSLSQATFHFPTDSAARRGDRGEESRHLPEEQIFFTHGSGLLNELFFLLPSQRGNGKSSIFCFLDYTLQRVFPVLIFSLVVGLYLKT